MTKIDLTPLSDVEPFFLVEKTAVHPGRVMLALGYYVEDLKDLPASGLGGYLDHVESNHGSCLVQYTPTEIGRLRITPMRKVKDEYVPVEIGSYHAQMWNYVKAVCCCDYYNDLDIVNCHPVLILSLIHI